MYRTWKAFGWIRFALLLAAAGSWVQAQGKRDLTIEEGEFTILISGREIGSEKFAIQIGGDSVVSTSVVEFLNPGQRPQKIRLESRLEMDGNYLPRRYLLKSDVDGKKGTISGAFDPNQVMFDYRGTGSPFRRGLLLGDRPALLDSNIYHHFAFLVRRYDFKGGEQRQSCEVVIPQETDSGVLKISRLKDAHLTVRGKKRAMRVLLADSGALQIHLWVDDGLVLHKLAVPARGLEVLRR
jgi:hypothetical protein